MVSGLEFSLSRQPIDLEQLQINQTLWIDLNHSKDEQAEVVCHDSKVVFPVYLSHPDGVSLIYYVGPPNVVGL